MTKRTMHPGLYVVRMPDRGMGSRLHVASRCFAFHPGHERITEEWVRNNAQNWADFIQSQHPNDDVFVIERKPEGALQVLSDLKDRITRDG